LAVVEGGIIAGVSFDVALVKLPTGSARTQTRPLGALSGFWNHGDGYRKNDFDESNVADFFECCNHRQCNVQRFT